MLCGLHSCLLPILAHLNHLLSSHIYSTMLCSVLSCSLMLIFPVATTLAAQGRRNHQMEHGQQSETSQSDGSKRWSGEQSELSYPSTPQSQRSNH
ncbi:hypothetical protein EJB05_49602, partial [Eragrostis curvula]